MTLTIGIKDEHENYVYVQDKNGTLGEGKTSISVASGTMVTIRLYCQYGNSTENWAQKWKESCATANGVALTRTEQDGGNTYIFTCQVTENTTIDVWKNWGDGATAAVTISEPAAAATALSDSDTGSAVPATGGTKIDSVTLNSSNGWKKTFTDLPLTGTTEDGDVSYYYYFKEVEAPAGYVVSYSNGENAVKTGTVTITNTQTPTPSGTSLTVKKEWKNADGTNLTVDNYSVTVQLAQVATTITGETSEQTTTLEAVEDWNEYTFSTDDLSNSNLRIRVTYRTDANYYNWGYGAIYKKKDGKWEQIKELKVASGEAGTYSETYSLTPDCEKFAFNFWGSYVPKDQTDKIQYANLIKLELIKTVITDGKTTVTVNESYDTQTLNSGNKWEYRWPNLDSSKGNTIYTYYVKEVRVENAQHDNITDKFTVTNSNGDKENAVGVDGSITITNTLKSTYVLPETGGAGIGFYRIGGSLLMGVAAAGLIGNTKRKKRKEADKTS